MPVLLYGCEVWGFENIEIIERNHLKFLKHILNLKSCNALSCIRQKYLEPRFCERPNTFKFCELLSTLKLKKLKKLCLFINEIFESVCPP